MLPILGTTVDRNGLLKEWTLALGLLCLFAFLAGFIDAVAGGGGLIQLPAVFLFLPTLFPGASSAVLLGTNKFSSVWGTLAATWRYARHVQVPWRTVTPAAVMAAAASYLGASIVSMIPLEILRYLVLILLVVVAIYTFLRTDFGALRRNRVSGRTEVTAGLILGAVIGFYDGFFGPGTGSFLIFAFVAFFGYDFLLASASAKVVNLVTNVFALVFFVPHGEVYYMAAVPMAVCNVAGAFLGTRLAIARGSRFVRLLFLFVISLVIFRFAYDVFSSW